MNRTLKKFLSSSEFITKIEVGNDYHLIHFSSPFRYPQEGVIKIARYKSNGLYWSFIYSNLGFESKRTFKNVDELCAFLEDFFKNKEL